MYIVIIGMSFCHGLIASQFLQIGEGFFAAGRETVSFQQVIANINFTITEIDMQDVAVEGTRELKWSYPHAGQEEQHGTIRVLADRGIVELARATREDSSYMEKIVLKRQEGHASSFALLTRQEKVKAFVDGVVDGQLLYCQDQLYSEKEPSKKEPSKKLFASEIPEIVRQHFGIERGAIINCYQTMELQYIKEDVMRSLAGDDLEQAINLLIERIANLATGLRKIELIRLIMIGAGLIEEEAVRVNIAKMLLSNISNCMKNQNLTQELNDKAIRLEKARYLMDQEEILQYNCVKSKARINFMRGLYYHHQFANAQARLIINFFTEALNGGQLEADEIRDAYFHRGTYYHQQGEHDNAKRDFLLIKGMNLTIATNPTDEMRRMHYLACQKLGYIYFAQENWEQAHENLSSVLAYRELSEYNKDKSKYMRAMCEMQGQQYITAFGFLSSVNNERVRAEYGDEINLYLGLMLMKGVGVTKNIQEAMTYLRKSKDSKASVKLFNISDTRREQDLILMKPTIIGLKASAAIDEIMPIYRREVVIQDAAIGAGLGVTAGALGLVSVAIATGGTVTLLGTLGAIALPAVACALVGGALRFWWG